MDRDDGRALWRVCSGWSKEMHRDRGTDIFHPKNNAHAHGAIRRDPAQRLSDQKRWHALASEPRFDIPAGHRASRRGARAPSW